jgi:hypothetical protein
MTKTASNQEAINEFMQWLEEKGITFRRKQNDSEIEFLTAHDLRGYVAEFILDTD